MGARIVLGRVRKRGTEIRVLGHVAFTRPLCSRPGCLNPAREVRGEIGLYCSIDCKVRERYQEGR